MAYLSSAFEFVISAVLGPVTDLNGAIIKLGLFAMLFAAFAKGLKRVFPENRKASNIISIILAILAIRLMPDIWFVPLGKFLWVVVVIILPYLVVDGIVREWNLIKLILLSATYFGIYLLLSSTAYWGFGGIIQFGNDLVDYWFAYRWQMIVLAAIVVAYFSAYFGKKRKPRKL